MHQLIWAIVVVFALGSFVQWRNIVIEGSSIALRFMKLDEQGIRTGGCSGTHVGAGRVVTAAHCGEGFLLRTGNHGGRGEHLASVVYRDQKTDVMILDIPLIKGRPSAAIDCTVMDRFTPIEVVGFPSFAERLVRSFGHTTSSVLSRLSWWEPAQLASAPSGAGGSGGGVFDLQGRLRGILVGGTGNYSIIVPIPCGVVK